MSFDNNRFASAVRDIKITGNMPVHNCSRQHILRNLPDINCKRGHIVENMPDINYKRGHIIENMPSLVLTNTENFTVFAIIK